MRGSVTGRGIKKKKKVKKEGDCGEKNGGRKERGTEILSRGKRRCKFKKTIKKKDVT